MAEVTLVSAALMGFVLLAIVVGMSRLRSWHAAPASVGQSRSIEETLSSPGAMGAAFVVVALGLVAVSVAFVNESFMGLDQGIASLIFFGLLGLGFALFLAGGVYVLATNRGLPRSMATAAASVTLATLLLLAIVAQLVFGT